MSFRSYRYQSFDRDRIAMLPAHAQDALLDEDMGDPREGAALRTDFAAGHAQGFAEGRDAALQEAEARLVQCLPEALGRLSEATSQAEAARRASGEEALLLVRSVLRQLLPKLADRLLSFELAAQVADVIAGAQTPNIEIRCAEKTRDVLGRLCGPVPAGVELVADPALAEGSLACTWADGSASFDADALRQAILTIIDRCLDEAKAMKCQPEQASS